MHFEKKLFANVTAMILKLININRIGTLPYYSASLYRSNPFVYATVCVIAKEYYKV